MAGFGPIGADEAARLLAQAMGELPELAEKVLAELPKDPALRESQDQPEQSAVSSQPVQPADESNAPAADVRRNIALAKNDAPQKESDS